MISRNVIENSLVYIIMGCCASKKGLKVKKQETDEDINRKVEELFQQYDKNNKGSFSKAEFRNILKN